MNGKTIKKPKKTGENRGSAAISQSIGDHLHTNK
jgi:hypothetical protein